MDFLSTFAGNIDAGLDLISSLDFFCTTNLLLTVFAGSLSESNEDDEEEDGVKVLMGGGNKLFWFLLQNHHQIVLRLGQIIEYQSTVKGDFVMSCKSGVGAFLFLPESTSVITVNFLSVGGGVDRGVLDRGLKGLGGGGGALKRSSHCSFRLLVLYC